MNEDKTKPLQSNPTTVSSKKLAFSSAERELIAALVRERPIIEDKRINSKNIELKKQAWQDLTVAYNSHPYVTQRLSQQLKRCWENMKSQRKKELSQESISLKRTSGDTPEISIVSDNGLDPLCPHINLRVPGGANTVINDTHSEYGEIPIPEYENAIKQDQALHELRIQREHILIEREKNLLQYEKKIHDLQLEKIKLEIQLLTKQIGKEKS